MTAEPILRTMWQEFPDDLEVYDINSQFMIGDGILFAPKVTEPTAELIQSFKQQVNYYLPISARWYNYQTKLEETEVGKWQQRNLTDLEQAIFVKGGTILPLLQHDGCLSILSCFENSITLEVYPDSENKAKGKLYVDDGESFDYLSDENASAYIQFSYEDGILSSSFISGAYYVFPSTQVVTKVQVFGLPTQPWQLHVES